MAPPIAAFTPAPSRIWTRIRIHQKIFDSFSRVPMMSEVCAASAAVCQYSSQERPVARPPGVWSMWNRVSKR
jgi:hypothetical protein